MLRAGWVAVACIAVSGVAAADDSNPDSIQIHAFASQGALLSTGNNFVASSKDGTLEFTEAGINFTKQLDDRLSIGIQLFARDLGGASDYPANFDWFDLDYRWRDWLGIRAGRVKLPFGLYNDSADIDAAHPVVLLPQSIYSLGSREFMLAQTGLELYGYRPLDGGDAGALQYTAYFGALSLPLSSSPSARIDDDRTPYITGGRVIYETPLDGLRVVASALVGKIEGDITILQPMQLPSLPFTIFAVEGIGSVEYQANGLWLAAEYLRDREKSTEGPASARQTLEAMYGMAGYHWRPWFMTTAYYSLEYPNVAHKSGTANQEHDAALCLRFDITPRWLFKLEAHYLRGTAELDPTLNGNTPLDKLDNQWTLFAAKTTVYF